VDRSADDETHSQWQTELLDELEVGLALELVHDYMVAIVSNAFGALVLLHQLRGDKTGRALKLTLQLLLVLLCLEDLLLGLDVSELLCDELEL
jgi:hypothetical protein